MTKIIPVVRPMAEWAFCNIPGTSKPFVIEEELEGTVIKTGFLRMDLKIDLLSISVVDALIANGLMDYTDSVAQDIHLAALSVGRRPGEVEGVIEIPSVVPLEDDQPYIEGDWREIRMAYASDKLRYDGRPLSIKAAGTINLQTATCQLVSESPTLDYDELMITGYRLEAYRINHNRRPRN